MKKSPHLEAFLKYIKNNGRNHGELLYIQKQEFPNFTSGNDLIMPRCMTESIFTSLHRQSFFRQNCRTLMLTRPNNSAIISDKEIELNAAFTRTNDISTTMDDKAIIDVICHRAFFGMYSMEWQGFWKGSGYGQPCGVLSYIPTEPTEGDIATEINRLYHEHKADDRWQYTASIQHSLMLKKLHILNDYLYQPGMPDTFQGNEINFISYRDIGLVHACWPDYYGIAYHPVIFFDATFKSQRFALQTKHMVGSAILDHRLGS